MHKDNLDYISRKITILIVNILKSEEETYQLKSLTNAHRDAWVKAARQVIEKIEEGIKIAEETDYDKLYL
jgi:DNA-binding protein H-NS